MGIQAKDCSMGQRGGRDLPSVLLAFYVSGFHHDQMRASRVKHVEQRRLVRIAAMQGTSTLRLGDCTQLASWVKVETLEQFRGEVVDGAFAAGYECLHDGSVVWFVRLGEQRVEFSLNVEGLCAARRWLAGLDRRLVA